MADSPGDAENLELVRRALEAFVTGDLDGAFAAMDAEMVFENRTQVPDLEGTYVGRDGLLQMLGKIYEVFEDYRLEPLEIETAGEGVAALVRESGHGRISGIETGRQLLLLYTITNGKIARIDATLCPQGNLREALAQT